MTVEYRECIVEIEQKQRKGCFHQWNQDGSAIVEFDDGRCRICKPYQITFTKPITFDYDVPEIDFNKYI